jgi:hypothetical protein
MTAPSPGYRRADPLAPAAAAPVEHHALRHPGLRLVARSDGQGGRRRRGRPARTLVEYCEEHIAALYAVAYAHLGDRRAAEDAVIAAVAHAAGLPAASEGVTVSVWHLLAAHFHAQGDQTGSPGAPVETRADALVHPHQQTPRPGWVDAPGGVGATPRRARPLTALYRGDI